MVAATKSYRMGKHFSLDIYGWMDVLWKKTRSINDSEDFGAKILSRVEENPN